MTDEVEGPTDRLARPDAPDRPARSTSVLTATAGVLACVLVIMAAGMVGAQVVAGQHGQQGPGAVALGAHVAAAAVGIAGYRLVSRRVGVVRPVACGVLLAIAALLLWFFWWAA